MTAKDLLKPRFEVIADYPENPREVGDIISQCTEYMVSFYEQYPHLFRKLNWWEHRKVEDMPKKVKAVDFDNVYTIEEWDMVNMIGWVNKERRKVCDLRLFKPECGYFPVD